MRKYLVSLMILAVAGVASAETMWGINDDWNSTPVAEICAWDAATGAGIVAPTYIANIEHTYGLAVVGQQAYISAQYAGVGDAIVHYDLNTMSTTLVVPTPEAPRGLTMSLDGSILYGGMTSDDNIHVVNPLTGVTVPVASAVDTTSAYTDYQYWSALPGEDVRTNDFWTCSDHYRYHVQPAPPAGVPTYVNRFFDDQTSSAAWGLYDATGYIYHSKVVRPGIIWYGDPLVMTGTGQQAGSYDVIALNGWTFFAPAGFYGMSPVFIPEPATMSLLALGGLGLLARKRR
jgi:hypothetical protein